VSSSRSDRTAGDWAGEVVLNDLDSENRSCGFRIALVGPEFFGRGLGTEASRLVLANAFNVVGLHRTELEIYTFNPRARHDYEKVDSVSEGTLRDTLPWDGAWIDADSMPILAKEWSEPGGRPQLAPPTSP
jgi:RimJ/RimL family protein N-acetyltransferase